MGIKDDRSRIFFQIDTADAPRRRSSDHMIEQIIGMLIDYQKRFDAHATSTTEYRIANDKRISEVVDGQQNYEKKIDGIAVCIEQFNRAWVKTYKPKLDRDLESNKFWTGTKDESIKNVVKGTVWLLFVGVCSALWLLLKDSLGIKK